MAINDMGPLQDIVNVHWGDSFRYWVFELFSNTNASGNGLPTTIDEIRSTTLLSEGELAATFNYTGGSIDFAAHPEFFQYTDYQNINSIAKRKALIDDVFLRTGGGGSNPPDSPNPPTHTENYFLGTLEGFFPTSGPLVMQGVQVGYIYLLGRYALAHPNTTHFETSAPDFFPGIFQQIDRPFTEASLIAAGARNWGAPLPDFDGAPHNPYP